MTSNSFLPLISRSSRITATSATLIDNIFTNYLENCGDSSQGLRVTDVTDHYPIFHINRQITTEESEVYVFKRSYSLKNKNVFLDTIRGIDWNEIYNNSGTQKYFDLFHGKLLTLLYKFFPKVRRKIEYNNKKNLAYLKLCEIRLNIRTHCIIDTKECSQFIMKRCINPSYKSRLQKLMIAAEKQYYHAILLQNKDNMKNSWGIIKNIINKNRKPVYQSNINSSQGR